MTRGGEKLESVIGREEGVELPDFEYGAFQIESADRSRIGKEMVDEGFLDKFVEVGAVARHSMRELISSIRFVGADEFVCSKVGIRRFFAGIWAFL